MQPVTRRRAAPVYIAAAVFAVYALIFPLYKLWHFLLAAAVTAAAWLLAEKLIKPVVEYVPVPEPEPEPPVSHGAEADAVLAEAKTARLEMEALAAAIGDPAVTEKIEALCSLSDRIAQDILDDPADAREIQKFQRYFLPSTIGLLHAYDRMGRSQGENAAKSREKIAQMLDTEIRAFQKQLDALYKNDAMDVDANIRVMQALLEREGLLEQDELHRLIQQAEEAGTGT